MELECKFPKVVRVPEDELHDEVARWDETTVVVRCFGRWVAPEAVVREFHKAGVAGDVQAFELARGYYIFNLPNADEWEKVVDRPWTVNGQILAVEEWRRAFLPSEEAITSTLVWVRLPHLPAELWGEAALQRLVEDAGEFVMVDEFTSERRRLGFARVCIRVDLSRSLLPGVRIDGPNDVYWCSRGVDRVLPAEASGSSEAAGEEGRHDPIRRGAWMVAVRQQTAEAGVTLLPGMSDPSGGKAAVQTAATAAGDWRQPSKLACRGKSPQFPSPASSGEAAVGGGGNRGRDYARVPGFRAGPEWWPNNQFLVFGSAGGGRPNW